MAESSPPDGRSPASTLYSSFRRKIKTSRSETSSSFDSEASATTATSDDSVLTVSTDLTSVESIPETKGVGESTTTVDTIDQGSSSPKDEVEANPLSESDPLPQERRSKRKMFAAAFKSGIQASRSLTASLLSETSGSKETAAKSPALVPGAKGDNKVLSTPPLVESPPPTLSSFSGLSLTQSIDGSPASKDGASAAVDASSPEPQSTNSIVYAALRSRLPGGKSPTLSSVSSDPEVKVASVSVVSTKEEVDAATTVNTVSSLSATQVQSGKITAVITTEQTLVVKDEDLDKKVDKILPPTRQDTLEIRALPEITEMLKSVESLDVTNDVICSFEATSIVGNGGYGDIYIGTLRITLENGETVDLKVAVKCFRTHAIAEKAFVRVSIVHLLVIFNSFFP